MNSTPEVTSVLYARDVPGCETEIIGKTKDPDVLSICLLGHAWNLNRYVPCLRAPYDEKPNENI